MRLAALVATLLLAPSLAFAAPRHVVVLLHGFLGNGWTGPHGYWSDIPQLLAAKGTRVVVAATHPAHSPFERARALRETIDRAAALSETGRVNVVAHSMGGLDARVLASHLGYADRIASITTLATPHRGSPLAEFAADLLADRCAGPALPFANAAVALFFGWTTPQDLRAGVHALTPAAMARFNETVADDPRTAYFSVVAKSTFSLDRAMDGADLVDAPLLPTFALLDARGLPSDGLVPLESQRWGEVLAEVNADHQNLVGQPFGLTGLQFDHRHFFAFLADRLAERGM